MPLTNDVYRRMSAKIEVNDDRHCLFMALRIGYYYVLCVKQIA